MVQKSTLILVTVMLINCGIAFGAESPLSGSFQLGFSTDVVLDEEGELMLTYQGMLYWDVDRFRVDITSPITKESVFVIGNFSDKRISVCYPDTLNGFSMDMPGEMSAWAGKLGQILDPESKIVPAGWKKQAAQFDPSKDTAPCQPYPEVKLDFESNGDRLIQVFLGKHDVPLFMIYSEEGRVPTINSFVTQVHAVESFKDTKFEVPEGYTMQEKDFSEAISLVQL